MEQEYKTFDWADSAILLWVLLLELLDCHKWNKSDSGLFFQFIMGLLYRYIYKRIALILTVDL